MVKKMIVDIPTHTINTTWPNEKMTTIQIKRENHGNKGNTWFYRSANNNEPLGDWKLLEPSRLIRSAAPSKK